MECTADQIKEAVYRLFFYNIKELVDKSDSFRWKKTVFFKESAELQKNA